MNNKGLLLILLLVLMAMLVFAESPTGIEIQTEMPDVQVWVDGAFAGTTTEFRPGKNRFRVVDLQPGSHTVECRLERYQPFVTTVEVTQSTIQPVVVRFTSPETEAIGIQSASGELQAQTGSIRVLSDPTGAVVELDGQRQTALTDLLLTPVTVGPHRICAYFDGDTEDEKLSIEVTVHPDAELEVVANFWDRTIRTNATYSIHLRSNVESAVFIDEAEAGTTGPDGGRFTLTNGNHTIELRSPGYEVYRRSVDLTGDEFISVDMTPIEHRVSISSVPAGVPVVQVLPDGSRKSVGRSPVTVAVATGATTFYLDENGYDETSLVVDAGPDTRVIRRLVTLERATCTIDVPGTGKESAVGATVTINGDRIGTVPLHGATVSAELVDIRIGEAERSVHLAPGGHYELRSTAFQGYLPLPTTSEGLPGHEDVPPEPVLSGTTRTVDVVTGVDLSVQGGTIAAGVGAVAATAAMLLAGLEPSADTIIPGVILGGGAGVLVAILLAGNRVEPREVPDKAAIRRNETVMANYRSAVAAVEQHNRQLLETEVARVQEENRRIADQNFGRGILDIRDASTNQAIPPYPVPLSDEEISGLMQGTWVEAVPPGAGDGRKYQFEGDAYRYWQPENKRLVLQETGTFRIKDGEYIETALKVRDGGTLRDVRDGDLVEFEHGSFYVDPQVLSLNLQMGKGDSLIGTWKTVGADTYFTSAHGRLVPAWGYDTQWTTFDPSECSHGGTRVTFAPDGTVATSEDYSNGGPVVEYRGGAYTYTDGGRRHFGLCRVVGRTESITYLANGYYIREVPAR